MKKLYKGILTVVLACCVVLSLAACGGTPSASDTNKDSNQTATLSRYDYIADMNGNPTEFTIAQNLKSVQIGITSMKLEITAYCKVEDDILTITGLAEGNEQFYKGVSAHAYKLNADGTAVPTDAAETTSNSTGLSRYDYIADMNGNPTEFTIAQNLKTVQIGISSMKLNITAYCKVEDNVLTITELAEGNEQFYKGVSAHTYLLNEDGTAVPQD